MGERMVTNIANRYCGVKGKIVTVLAILFMIVPFLAERSYGQGYLKRFIGKDSSTVASASHGVRMDSSFFITRIGGQHLALMQAILDRGVSANDYSSLTAAKNAAKDSNWVLIIPPGYSTDSTLTLTSADSNLTVFDFRGIGLTINAVIGIKSQFVPTSSLTDGVRLYVEDVSGSAELKVRDEAGNIVTLSDLATKWKDGTNYVYLVTSSDSVGIGTSTPSEKLDVSGGIKLGNATGTNEGTIRWTGTDLEVYKSSSWVSLTAGATGGEANTASNLAGTGVGIFKTKSGVDLQFKRLKAGNGISITDNTDSVTVASAIVIRDGGAAISSSPTDLDFNGSQFAITDATTADSVEIKIATDGITSTEIATNAVGKVELAPNVAVEIIRISGGSTLTRNDTLTFKAGSNVTLSASNDTLTIAASGGGSSINVRSSGTSVSSAPTDMDFSSKFTVTDANKADSVEIDIASGAITTTEISDGTITNADISSSAAIAESKLSFNTNDGSRHDHVAADITDTNAGTDITADLEEESHATEHDGSGIGVSGETLNIKATDGIKVSTDSVRIQLKTGSGLQIVSGSGAVDSLAADSTSWIATDSDVSAKANSSVTLTAGDGLSGGGDLSANRTFAVNLDTDGGLETVDDSINVKLDGSTLTTSSAGLKVATGGITATEIATDAVGTAELAPNIAVEIVRISGGSNLTRNDTLTFAAGANISLTASGDTLTISASGSTSPNLNTRDGGTLISSSPTDYDFNGTQFTISDANKADSVEISIASGGITTTEIADGTIVNADISASAAIVESKLSFNTNDGSRHDHVAADIADQNAGTDITADLEEEAHATEHDGDGVSISGETINVNVDYNGGLETVDDSLNIKLDGSTLSLSSTGLKVATDGITATEIAADAVGTSELAANVAMEILKIVGGSSLTRNDTLYFAAGSNVTLSASNDTLTIAASGGSAAINIRSAGTSVSASPTDMDFSSKFTVTDANKADSVEIDIASGAITTTEIADGTITNADISASAGIVESKLSFNTNDGSRHDHVAADITDQNAGTDITADLEEEAHATEHDGDGIGVSGETLNVLLDAAGGLETVDDSVNIKLDGSTLSLSSAGLKVADGVLIGDTVMVELPASAFDTTASGGPAAMAPTGFREFYWEFDASTAETLLVSFELPDYFSSFARIQGVIETEDTSQDTLNIDMEGFADDEPHATDLTLATAGAAQLVFGAETAANDLSTAEDRSITGTYSAGDHIHLLVVRPAGDAGVIRFFGLKLYIVRTR